MRFDRLLDCLLVFLITSFASAEVWAATSRATYQLSGRAIYTGQITGPSNKLIGDVWIGKAQTPIPFQKAIQQGHVAIEWNPESPAGSLAIRATRGDIRISTDVKLEPLKWNTTNPNQGALTIDRVRDVTVHPRVTKFERLLWASEVLRREGYQPPKGRMLHTAAILAKASRDYQVKPTGEYDAELLENIALQQEVKRNTRRVKQHDISIAIAKKNGNPGDLDGEITIFAPWARHPFSVDSLVDAGFERLFNSKKPLLLFTKDFTQESVDHHQRAFRIAGIDFANFRIAGDDYADTLLHNDSPEALQTILRELGFFREKNIESSGAVNVVSLQPNPSDPYPFGRDRFSWFAKFIQPDGSVDDRVLSTHVYGLLEKVIRSFLDDQYLESRLTTDQRINDRLTGIAQALGWSDDMIKSKVTVSIGMQRLTGNAPRPWFAFYFPSPQPQS